MGKYRKKPIVIEAVQYTGADNLHECMEFINTGDRPCTWNSEGLQIHTLEGTHTATEGDFIIKGVQGEFYPCKPDIFEATYNKEG